ncbi:DUF1508 domain-containing protein [Exiguobacterium sp. A1_3_1]|uniref:YegP family protein n=1 Tax=Exiguobacterium sp. A1_3_1 TaxID=2651871 RepID=UPI003B8663DC
MRFEIDFNSKGEPYFRFVANNNKTLFHSQGYDDIRDCKHAIELTKQYAAQAEVVDVRHKSLY